METTGSLTLRLESQQNRKKARTFSGCSGLDRQWSAIRQLWPSKKPPRKGIQLFIGLAIGQTATEAVMDAPIKLCGMLREIRACEKTPRLLLPRDTHKWFEL